MRFPIWILTLVSISWTPVLTAQELSPARMDFGNLWAQERSVFIEAAYYGEVFTNARGGISTDGATQYLGLFDLFMTIDLERLQSAVPGKFVMLTQNTHGRGLTENFVGDTQVLSNIDSFNNIMQVGEYWWESTWLDRQLTLRLGKQDFNTEFQRIDGAEHFIQSTFGLSPSTAFPTYPDQALAAVALAKLGDSTQFKSGVWSAFAKGGKWGISESDSFLLVGELEHRYWLAGDELPGIFAIGAVYESAGVIDGQSVSPVHEYFVQFEQLIYRECPWDNECRQGLALFGGYYPRFPGDQKTEKSIGDSSVAGITYTGFLPGRDDDVLGIGIALAELFQGGTNRERVTEIFYRAMLTPRASLQPDMQYIASPSGIYRDALAVGIRFELRS
ncbi:carbohydrate porin [Pirellulaceae bacterium SH449]